MLGIKAEIQCSAISMILFYFPLKSELAISRTYPIHSMTFYYSLTGIVAGVFLMLGSIIVWGGKDSKANTYSAVFIAAFGLFTVIYSGYRTYADNAEYEARIEFLDAKLASGECRILALEEASFGSSSVRYKCSDGVEVSETIGQDRFKQLLKRQQGALAKQ